jgi:hypothetical protein
MKHIEFYQMQIKKENTILIEVFEDEIHFEVEDFLLPDLM